MKEVPPSWLTQLRFIILNGRRPTSTACYSSEWAVPAKLKQKLQLLPHPELLWGGALKASLKCHAILMPFVVKSESATSPWMLACYCGILANPDFSCLGGKQFVCPVKRFFFIIIIVSFYFFLNTTLSGWCGTNKSIFFFKIILQENPKMESSIF